MGFAVSSLCFPFPGFMAFEANPIQKETDSYLSREPCGLKQLQFINKLTLILKVQELNFVNHLASFIVTFRNNVRKARMMAVFTSTLENGFQTRSFQVTIYRYLPCSNNLLAEWNRQVDSPLSFCHQFESIASCHCQSSRPGIARRCLY